MQPWTTLPEAAALIADCAARSPKLRHHRQAYAFTTDHWHEYSRRDPRVRRLHEIRDHYFETVVLPAYQSMWANGRPSDRDLAGFNDVLPRVEEAIDAAASAFPEIAEEVAAPHPLSGIAA